MPHNPFSPAVACLRCIVIRDHTGCQSSNGAGGTYTRRVLGTHTAPPVLLAGSFVACFQVDIRKQCGQGTIDIDCHCWARPVPGKNLACECTTEGW